MEDASQTGTMTDEKGSRAFLECIKCREAFTDPVTLQCGHTFCNHCVGERNTHNEHSEDNQTVTCHLCGPQAKRPDDSLKDREGQIKTAFFVKRIAEEYTASTNDKEGICGICEDNGDTKPAVLWCSECDYALCTDCDKVHKKLHPSHTASDKAGDAVRKIRLKCGIHQDASVDQFCEDCEKAECPKCCLVYHKECKVSSLDVSVSRIDQLLEDCTKELEKELPEIECHISDCESVSKKLTMMTQAAEKAIDETGDGLVAEIQKQQKELKEQLHQNNNRHLHLLGEEVKTGKLRLLDARQRIGFAEEVKNSASEMDHYEVYKIFRSARDSRMVLNETIKDDAIQAANVRFQENKDYLVLLEKKGIGHLSSPMDDKEKQARTLERKDTEKNMKNGPYRRDETFVTEVDGTTERSDKNENGIAHSGNMKMDKERDRRHRKEEKTYRERNVIPTAIEKTDTRNEVTHGRAGTNENGIAHSENMKIDKERDRKHRKEEKTYRERNVIPAAIEKTDTRNEVAHENARRTNLHVRSIHKQKDSKPKKVTKSDKVTHRKIAKVDTGKKGIHGITVLMLGSTKIIVVTYAGVSSVQTIYGKMGREHMNDFHVGSPAYGITQLNDTTAAVAMPKKKRIGILEVGPNLKDDLKKIREVHFGMAYFEVTCLRHDPPDQTILAVSSDVGNPIDIVDLSGRTLRRFGTDVSSKGLFLSSNLDSRLWISDTTNAKVLSCQFNEEWDVEFHSSKLEFTSPCGISQAVQGDVFVVDKMRHEIVQLDQKGQFISTFLNFSQDEISDPFCIHVDRDNVMYLSVDDRFINIYKIVRGK